MCLKCSILVWKNGVELLWRLWVMFDMPFVTLGFLTWWRPCLCHVPIRGKRLILICTCSIFLLTSCKIILWILTILRCKETEEDVPISTTTAPGGSSRTCSTTGRLQDRTATGSTRTAGSSPVLVRTSLLRRRDAGFTLRGFVLAAKPCLISVCCFSDAGLTIDLTSFKKPGEKTYTQRSRLFVGNLPAGTSEEEVEKLFSKYGKPSEIFINKDRGFGFIRLVRAAPESDLCRRLVSHVRLYFNEICSNVPRKRRPSRTSPKPSWTTRCSAAARSVYASPLTVQRSQWRTCLSLCPTSCWKRPFPCSAPSSAPSWSSTTAADPQGRASWSSLTSPRPGKPWTAALMEPTSSPR